MGGGVELVALAVEGQGSPRAVWSARQFVVDGVTLARGWDSLGDPDGELARERLPAVAANADGRLELVVTGGAVWHTWQGEFRGDWSGWHSLERPPGPGSAIGGSALARNRDGRLELFTKLSDGTLWHRWQTGPGRGPWHDWHSLERPGGNGFASPGAPPALASNPDGRLELVALAPTADGDLEVWQREQTAPNDGWIRWKSFGSPAKVFARLADFSEGLDRIGPPTLVHDGQRRLRLWSLAPGLVDGRITKFYNLAQTLPSGDDWTHGISLFSPPPDPQPAYIPQPADSPPA